MTMKGVPESVTSQPSKGELATRLDRVQALMREQELDCYVCFDPVNIYYLTHFANNVHERPFILVIPSEGTPTMVAPLLETSHVQTRARCDLEYATYYEFPAPAGQNWYDVYGALIKPGARVGIESSVPVGVAEHTPGKTLVADVVDEVRILKSAYEIGRNVHACQVVELGHEKILETCRPGVIEGAIYAAASGAVWPPSLSHDPHIVPGFRTEMEQGGPHVSISFAQVDGYGVELERTFFLGEVPDEAQAPFEAMFAARARTYELARPGAILSEIDTAVRKVITERGYGDRILHRTGHGFGITGHEAPYVAEGYERALEPGMLISVEPGIYIPGQGGFRHSDTVLITDDGCVSLTHAPETIEELTIPI
jgi:Xaa-Pro dipeptidase